MKQQKIILYPRRVQVADLNPSFFPEPSCCPARCREFAIIWSMLIRVESYSGYKADERPKALVMGDKRLEVKEVIDRWYGTDHDYFKVSAEDNCVYIIRHNRLKDEWELVMMERAV